MYLWFFYLTLLSRNRQSGVLNRRILTKGQTTFQCVTGLKEPTQYLQGCNPFVVNLFQIYNYFQKLIYSCSNFIRLWICTTSFTMCHLWAVPNLCRLASIGFTWVPLFFGQNNPCESLQWCNSRGNLGNGYCCFGTYIFIFGLWLKNNWS
jgi:hypothetical protein